MRPILKRYFAGLSAFGTGLALLLIISTGALEAKTLKEMWPDVEIKHEKARQLVETMDFQQGTVVLGAGGVKLNVPEKYYFLGPVDARKTLTEIWGNPPSSAGGVLGMILPSDKLPIQDTWGAVVRFDEDGYVSDEEAGKMNYDDLLKSMQEGTEEASAERVKAGFGSMKLIGWASPPFYDKEQKKLHWAKELEFDGKKPHTLNYDVRALGRRGVLKINFVAGMEDLPVIRKAIPDVMTMAEFEAGSRYADYVPGVDKVATYGIGGLIAGKLLAKTGLFALLLIFLKKGWFIIALALAGLARGATRFFKR